VPRAFLALPILALYAACQGAPAFHGVRHPSILIVLVDSLRPDYLGIYGFDGEISPAIDRLATESVLFENSFSTAPWTKPAVASLLTSLYPEVHGVTNHLDKYWSGKSSSERAGVLPQEAATLAESLSANGYRTAAFVANPWFGKEFGFDQGFEEYQTIWETEPLLAAAASWIHSNDRRPFFAYVHLMDVHAPYEVRRRDYHALLKSRSLGPERTLTEEEYRAFPEHVLDTVVASDSERLDQRAWRAKYAASVRSVDRRLAPFVDDLRRSGVLEDAFLVLTADHGEELLQHGYWEHGLGFCDHQLRIPLLIRKPGAAQGGSRVTDLVSLVDLMPTLLSAAAVGAPPGLQGRDASRLLNGTSLGGEETIYSYATVNDPALHALRTRTHKLVLDTKTDVFQLFDLGVDPEEERDLAAIDSVSGKGLRDRLWEHLARMEARGPLAAEAAPLSDELRERLRALGYVH
jgi:arylsulfatase A-like enzyme